MRYKLFLKISAIAGILLADIPESKAQSDYSKDGAAAFSVTSDIGRFLNNDTGIIITRSETELASRMLLFSSTGTPTVLFLTYSKNGSFESKKVYSRSELIRVIQTERLQKDKAYLVLLEKNTFFFCPKHQNDTDPCR